MRTITVERAKEELRKRARQMGVKDIDEVIANSKILYEKAQNGALADLVREVKLLGTLVWDYKRGAYTTAPWTTIASAGAALAYIINPLDVIPDFLPIIGLVDDTVVLKVCLTAIKTDLDDYKKWLAKQKSEANK